MTIHLIPVHCKYLTIAVIMVLTRYFHRSALPASEMRCSEATQCIGCCINLAQDIDAAFQVATDDLDAIVLRCCKLCTL